MKNGISYPLAPEIIEMIEKQRKIYIENKGVKISQANFTSIIAPKLKCSIEKLSFNFPKKHKGWGRRMK